jgi:hypothetical protein
LLFRLCDWDLHLGARHGWHRYFNSLNIVKNLIQNSCILKSTGWDTNPLNESQSVSSTSSLFKVKPSLSHRAYSRDSPFLSLNHYHITEVPSQVEACIHTLTCTVDGSHASKRHFIWPPYYYINFRCKELVTFSQIMFWCSHCV